MNFRKLTTVLAIAGLSLGLASCGDDSTKKEPAKTSTTAMSTTPGVVALPSADELNHVIAVATDPAAPVEEKVRTVQGGDTAPELFEIMTASKHESGADFQVVDPVLPGYTADTVLATVNFTLPEHPAQVAENVEFIFEDGTWKLSDSWACTLISSTVPEQLPAMCNAKVDAPIVQPPAPAPMPEQPAEMPAEAPAQ
ncbi:hypothetical protein [Corynebacterium caspium]|uniref:hypothetical protein n=1 Tax=Corynebacterium caspium TaxID=234828 RepID=UPI000378780E|nr:hypothetical protein [Corynebacterium caspium]WKD59010.1 hypothetical protein CCASP_03030 [Corynebacterium caspium DSM 44850]